MKRIVYIFIMFIILLSFNNSVYAYNVSDGWHMVNTISTSTYPSSCTQNGVELSCPTSSSGFYTMDRPYDWAYYNNDVEVKRLNRMISVHNGYGMDIINGNSVYYQANSLISNIKAKEKGYDSVEVDVRFTSDHIPVIAHDDCLYEDDGYLYNGVSSSGIKYAKNKNGRRFAEEEDGVVYYIDSNKNRVVNNDIKKCISKMNYNELKNYKYLVRFARIVSEENVENDCDMYFHDKYISDSNYCKRIPLIDDIIELAKNNKLFLNIEIKAGNEEEVKNFVKNIDDNNLESSVRYMSYSMDILEYVLAENNKAILNYISSSSTKEELKSAYNHLKSLSDNGLVAIQGADFSYNDNGIIGIASADINANTINNYPTCCFNVPKMVINLDRFNIKSEKYIVFEKGTVSNLKNTIGVEGIVVSNNGENVGNEDLAKTGNDVNFGAYNYKIAISGDVNGDGNITMSDVSKVYRSVKGGTSLSELEKVAADKNNNNIINISDVSAIYRNFKNF